MATIVFTRALERFLPVPTVEVDGETLNAALAAVFDTRPGLRSYILDDQGTLRRHINIFISGRPVQDRSGLTDPIGPDDEIYVIQALTGG